MDLCYGDQSFQAIGHLPAVSQVSLTYNPGEVVGWRAALAQEISRLVMLACGLYIPDEGSFYFIIDVSMAFNANDWESVSFTRNPTWLTGWM